LIGERIMEDKLSKKIEKLEKKIEKLEKNYNQPDSLKSMTFIKKKILVPFGVISSFIVATVLFAATIPNVFTSGTTISSSDVNSNFSYIISRLWEKGDSSSDFYFTAGNVGIGLVNPTKTLDVSGDIKANTFFGDGSGLTGIGSGDISYGSTASSPANAIYVNDSGNVGIGTVGQTTTLEVGCPAGFTNIKSGDNQLGCIQTDEEGSGTFFEAVDDCFDTYGGRLPTVQERYTADLNFALTNEVGDYELTGERDGQDWVIVVDGTTFNAIKTNITSIYRCWIPR
jgi:hypothetical protein